MNAGDYHDPWNHNVWARGPGTDDKPPAWKAVAVGVGATAAVATAMYFLGGREAPKVPTLEGLGDFAKREVGFGALNLALPPESIASKVNSLRNEYGIDADKSENTKDLMKIDDLLERCARNIEEIELRILARQES